MTIEIERERTTRQAWRPLSGFLKLPCSYCDNPIDDGWIQRATRIVMCPACGANGYPHGTLSAYTHGRCRCQKCRRAFRDYNHGRRDNLPLPLRSALIRSRREHGTVTMYRKGRCRCDACKTAQRESIAAFRAGLS